MPAYAAQSEFHIDALPLNQALVKLALQAGISISHTGVDFRDARGNAVDGRLPLDTALQELLAGTGYTFVFLDPETIQIQVGERKASVGVPLLDEVVITASKTAGIARLLPASIAVLSGSDLADSGTQASNDLGRDVAAFNATNLGAGQDKLFIRGLSDSTISGRSQSMVGLYLDETQTTDDAPDPALRLIDIDQIEIVRGPQGTLYGAGTLGGLIRIITNKPVLDRVQEMASVSGSFTRHGAPSGSADAMLNLPIVENSLGIRAVAYVTRQGGYIDDSRLGRSNINNTNTAGGRVSLLWQANNNWTATLSLVDQNVRADDTQYVQAGQPSLVRANYVAEPHSDHFFLTSLTIDGDLGWANLVTSTAFTKRTIADQYDASLAWSNLTGNPTGASSFNDVRVIQSITHETRLASAGEGPWTWVSGLFLTHRDEDYRSWLRGPDAASTVYLARTEKRDDHADEAALFGEASYRMASWLSVTAGARVFYSSLGAESKIWNAVTATTGQASGNNRTPGITKKVAITIHPQDNWTLYASASEGFRLGGININGPSGATNVNASSGGESGEDVSANAFAPDRLWTYEVGTKSSLFNGRLMVDAAAWLTDWRDAQSDQILSDGSLYIANVGDVRAPGIELELSVEPATGLRLAGNFFWTDPKIVHANPLLIQTDGRLPGVPEMSFGFSGRYDMTLGGGYDAFIGADGSYIGKSHIGLDENNSAKMGNYFVSNLRLGASRDQWQATVYVNNLTDTQANTFAYGNPFLLGRVEQITPLRPLTIGVSLTWAD